MNRFSIKDLENLTGIKAHTIRIWEQRYGILQPKRTTTNIRYYDGSDLKTALRVALLNQYGYKISRIHKMTDADMDGLIQKIGDPDFKLQALVNKLLESALAMDMVSFETQINDYIRKHGIEETIEMLIFGFLEKVGTMWMTNRMIPAQEHLASNIIIRKLAVAIDALPMPEEADTTSLLLFLPEGEIHEMGLMYVHYLLRRQGHKVFYLGSNTPIKEAAALHLAHKPEVVYLHLTAAATETEFNRILKAVSSSFDGSTVVISGAMLRGRKWPEGSRLRYIGSLAEVKQFAAGLDKMLATA